ncbi:unnamed protein product [Spirodela intermedia]|uniref:Uncharacterized protein n=2 Tax=Spirodela intermedia TaxID=51605 RepID=A0A7I8JKT3_SPIIN|nr:unnamed protein product [Spirodela intermedia]CAA6670759.1 unnamed protein product [Spirodela intermedia]CAA7407848.1 unnamed protein product [Spirodela intermedia]
MRAPAAPGPPGPVAIIQGPYIENGLRLSHLASPPPQGKYSLNDLSANSNTGWL